MTTSDHGSHPGDVDPPRLWMQRQFDSLFGTAEADPGPRTQPEILFVPGHGKDEIRRSDVERSLDELPPEHVAVTEAAGGSGGSRSSSGSSGTATSISGSML